MFFVDRMAAVLKPTDVFLAWLQQYDEDFADLTLAQLRANCSVFLLPDMRLRAFPSVDSTVNIC